MDKKEKLRLLKKIQKYIYKKHILDASILDYLEILYGKGTSKFTLNLEYLYKDLFKCDYNFNAICRFDFNLRENIKSLINELETEEITNTKKIVV